MQKVLNLFGGKDKRGSECVYSTSFRCSEETVQQLSSVREYMEMHDIRADNNSDVIRFSVKMGYIYACKVALANGNDLVM